ncbi:MAG: hypothetical protein KGI35_02460 [Burkholderiales bacterium]|nr:hypothetical protein [Burkholderiales bacterium]MDE2394220.1 hypothetical protein [Burkholderiales bacterium]
MAASSGSRRTPSPSFSSAPSPLSSSTAAARRRWTTWLRFDQDAVDSRVVTFSVSDSGPGISLADRPRLFKPYSRLGEPGAARPAGTELGLFISQGLARAMGSQIELDSEPGVGSRFRFSLTLPRIAGPAREPLAAGKKALLMISAAQTGATVAALLEGWGLELTRSDVAAAAFCGAAAHDLIVITDPDLKALRVELGDAAFFAAAAPGRLILIATTDRAAPPSPK